MIIRYRKRPLPLQKLDALISRLPENHPQIAYVQKEAAKQQKGYNGERKLDYHIEHLSDDYSIMADVCFTLGGKQTQIDSLIITAHAIFITEVKSIEGTVTFDTELRQCYRDREGEVERYKYPITQVQAIHARLLQLLQLAELGGLPIYYFVAFSERSTFINVKGEGHNLKHIVTYVEDIPFQIIRINEQLAAQNTSKNNQQLRQKIVQYIMHHCEAFDIDIYKKHHISQADILPGVHCPTCRHLGMKRLIGKWRCVKCIATSKTAHLESLRDYALLYSTIIKNDQCCHFLNIESRHTAKYLLQQAPNVKKNNRLTWIINYSYKIKFNNKL